MIIKLTYVVSNLDIGQCPAITCVEPHADSRLNGQWYEVARTRYDNERGDCNRHFISGDASEFHNEYKQLYRHNVEELNIVIKTTGKNNNSYTYQAFDKTTGAPGQNLLFSLINQIL